MRFYYKFLLVLGFLGSVTSSAQQDSLLFYQVEGKIIDSKIGKPVVYADVIIFGTNIGTITNIEGKFTLKIPLNETAESVVISSIGYNNKVIGISQLKTTNNLIKLDPASLDLAEIYIRPQDARELLISALNNIRNNYRTEPSMVTAFYRESIRRRRKYVAVAEAVLDAYKASYTKPLDRDRIKILKARKSTDFQKKDTLALKLVGGPFSMFQLDFVKSPGEILEREVLQYYKYEFSGQVVFDNKLAYMISFVQRPDIEVPLFEGKYYIDAETLAFLGAEYRINEERKDRASEFMVRQKPPGVEVDIEKAYYNVNYRYSSGKWHLSYVRTELALSMKWKKMHFRSRYYLVAEMAITDMDTVNITRFKNQNTVNNRDVFVEQVGNFEDPGFWGDYNIIYPEEPIQSAIKRMGRKLRRKTINAG